LYYQEEFNAEEKKILLNHFTNIDKPVFCLINLPEVVKGALFARYSRSPKSLRRLFLDEFWNDGDTVDSYKMDSSKAEDLYDRVFNQYGDDSVAQLGAAHIACEQSSNILTKVLEWGRMASYLEQSTRYIYYDRKLGDNYRYVIPPEIGNSHLKEKYVEVMNEIFLLYSELVRSLVAVYREKFPKEEGVSTMAYNGTMRAKACDVARYFLPTSTMSNVGIFASGQSYEQMIMKMRIHHSKEVRQYADMMLIELRKVIPSFLKRVDVENRGIEWSNYMRSNLENIENYANNTLGTDVGDTSQDVVLVDWERNAERKIAASCLYSVSSKSVQDLNRYVDKLTDEEVRKILLEYSGKRNNRRHKPGRAFESSYYTFDILSDYGAFRDLQRHRLMTIEWQKMSPGLGFDMPEEVSEVGMKEDCEKLVATSEDLHDLLSRDMPDLREYALLLGHKVRYSITMNVRQAFHLIELRTSKQGHVSYRNICRKMHELISEEADHKVISELMSFVDHDDYELQRLEAEKKQDKKRIKK